MLLATPTGQDFEDSENTLYIDVNNDGNNIITITDGEELQPSRTLKPGAMDPIATHGRSHL